MTLERKIKQIEQKMLGKESEAKDLSRVPDHLLRRFVYLADNDPVSPEIDEVRHEMAKYIP